MAILGHVPPFREDFDQSLENLYAQALASAEAVKISLDARQHTFSAIVPYLDGIQYPSTKERNYMVVSFWDSEYNIEKVTF